MSAKGENTEITAPLLRSRRVILCFHEGLRIKLSTWWITIKRYNKFDSASQQISIARLERIFTRLYVLIMCSAFIILATYTVLTLKTTIYTASNPSQSTYVALLAQHADTLECPCQHVAVPYDKFISVEWKLHQLCSSQFISPSFYLQLAIVDKQQIPYNKADFMWHSLAYFNWLHNFCSLSDLWLTKEYNYFASKLFINAKLITPLSFSTQTDQFLHSFSNDTMVVFVRSLQQVIAMNSVNGFITTSPTLYTLPGNVSMNAPFDGQVRLEPSGFNGCSCLLQPTKCSQSAAFYSYEPANHTFQSLWAVPGIRLGCLSLQSVFFSTLNCWYSDVCYRTVRKATSNRGKKDSEPSMCVSCTT